MSVYTTVRWSSKGKAKFSMYYRSKTRSLEPLKLAETQRLDFVQRLEAKDEAHVNNERRRSARFRIRDGVDCLISYDDKIYRELWFRAVPRNLSDHGAAVLHGAFVYPGSKLIARITMYDGECVELQGVVRRCDYVSGKVHDIGIEFDQPIDATTMFGAIAA